MLIHGTDVAGQTIEADVCIVGAGPAGLAVGVELDARGASVCLLESGGPASGLPRDLLAGTTVSPLHGPDFLQRSRAVGPGGTARSWEVDVGLGEPFVRYALPDAIDFEPRPPLRPEAWPFPLRSLDPVVRRAAALCGVPADADGDGDEDGAALPLRADDLRATFCTFGPAAVFTHDAPERLAGSASTTVILGSTAVELPSTRDRGRIESVRVATAGGSFRVRPRVVVLAAGAPENARLLLQRSGDDDGRDLVGRFVTDHPFVELGLLEPADRAAFESGALYDIRPRGGAFAMGYLTPARDALEREGLLNAAVFLFPRPRAFGSAGVDAVRALRRPGGTVLERTRQAARAAAGIRDVLAWSYQRRFVPGSATDGQAGGWSTLPGLSDRFAYYRLEAQLEQTVDAENRVALGSSRDSLGRPGLLLQWRWSKRDRESLERLRSFLGEVFSASGVGTFRPTGGIATAFSPHHLMGSTRMHGDPDQGVVDADCRVHGTDNLFVAGTSVFPTAAGAANPTLLAVALALRLSDHVATVL